MATNLTAALAEVAAVSTPQFVRASGVIVLDDGREVPFIIDSTGECQTRQSAWPYVAAMGAGLETELAHAGDQPEMP